MPTLRYSALTRDEVGLLLAPGAEKVEKAWDRLTGGLHTLLSLLTLTYARPLVPEADAREEIPEALAALKDSPLYAKALHNAQAVDQIDREIRQRRGTPELYRTVDEFIEAMLDEWNAIERYPDPPPVLTPVTDASQVYHRQYASGGR